MAGNRFHLAVAWLKYQADEPEGVYCERGNCAHCILPCQDCEDYSLLTAWQPLFHRLPVRVTTTYW